MIAGRKAYLFAFLDDHSRAVMAARWGYFEDTVRLAAALRPALAARGVPDAIYVDNGSAFVDAALKRAAARLGIKLTHSPPGRPQGRGKIERFFRTVREEFLVEIGDGGRQSRTWRELNRLFTAWVETVYHRPAALRDRAAAARSGGWPGAPFPAAVAGAAARGVLVVRAAHRRARPPRSGCSATLYEVDPVPGRPRASSCVFDPFDLTVIEVRWNGRPDGPGRPAADRPALPPQGPTPETPSRAAARPTGIDYLGILAAEHDEAARRHRIRYDALGRGDASEPGPAGPGRAGRAGDRRRSLARAAAEASAA